MRMFRLTDATSGEYEFNGQTTKYNTKAIDSLTYITMYARQVDVSRGKLVQLGLNVRWNYRVTRVSSNRCMNKFY